MDAFISQHLKGVSRTYAILIPMLPARLAEPVGLAYLLLRIIDTLEDTTALTNVERVAWLGRWDAALAQPGEARASLVVDLGESDAERALMRDSDLALSRLAQLDPPTQAPVALCARKMIGGVLGMLARSEARRVPYPATRDSAELRAYCYFVAGVVGEMLCELMAAYLRQPALMRFRPVAIELGIGLQLVNILKDALKDSTQGRRYLPTNVAGAVSRSEVYRAVLEEARTSLRKGAEFVMALPATAWELRSFCGLPIAWGAMTLRRAERDARRAKISRKAVEGSITRFHSLAQDDRALRAWLDRLLHARVERA